VTEQILNLGEFDPLLEQIGSDGDSKGMRREIRGKADAGEAAFQHPTYVVAIYRSFRESLSSPDGGGRQASSRTDHRLDQTAAWYVKHGWIPNQGCVSPDNCIND
jgi:hypothetical protein